MGTLIPIKVKNFAGVSTYFEDDSSFVFFYDDNKLRKCSQKKHEAHAISLSNDYILAVGG